MKLITPAAYRRARAYLRSHARPLDQARFDFLMTGASAEPVLSALAEYQNDDGGFGHALEPDMHTPASSAVATTLAFGVLREVRAPADLPLVRKAIDFLVNAFDRQRRVWEIVPPAVEDAVHAPWWSYADIEATFAGSELNPTAAVLSAFYDYATLVPADLLGLTTSTVLERLETRRDAVAPDELRCLVELAECPSLPPELRARVESHVGAVARHSIEVDPARWREYRLQPLEVMHRPDSFLAPVVDPALVELNLDYWVDQQGPDGSFPLTWSWAEVDVSAWARAERDAKGRILVDRLHTLRAFGRLLTD